MRHPASSDDQSCRLTSCFVLLSAADARTGRCASFPVFVASSTRSLRTASPSRPREPRPVRGRQVIVQSGQLELIS